MTRDQVAQLQELATSVQRWIESGNQREVPLPAIRALARLATIAANHVEWMSNRKGEAPPS